MTDNNNIKNASYINYSKKTFAILDTTMFLLHHVWLVFIKFRCGDDVIKPSKLYYMNSNKMEVRRHWSRSKVVNIWVY